MKNSKKKATTSNVRKLRDLKAKKSPKGGSIMNQKIKTGWNVQ
jgi:hypothetical protein